MKYEKVLGLGHSANKSTKNICLVARDYLLNEECMNDFKEYYINSTKSKNIERNLDIFRSMLGIPEPKTRKMLSKEYNISGQHVYCLFLDMLRCFKEYLGIDKYL